MVDDVAVAEHCIVDVDDLHLHGCGVAWHDPGMIIRHITLPLTHSLRNWMTETYMKYYISFIKILTFAVFVFDNIMNGVGLIKNIILRRKEDKVEDKNLELYNYIIKQHRSTKTIISCDCICNNLTLCDIIITWNSECLVNN